MVLKQRRADTTSKRCELFRNIIAIYCKDFNGTIGSMNENGCLKDVKIVDSLFYKRKNNRRRISDPIWIFGGIEQNSRNVF